MPLKHRVKPAQKARIGTLAWLDISERERVRSYRLWGENVYILEHYEDSAEVEILLPKDNSVWIIPRNWIEVLYE